MVIQRWQSVFLLFGAILSVVLNFVPWATVDESVITLSTNAIALTINILVAILFILAIFMYRNMRRQKTITSIGILLSVINNIAAVVLTYCGSPAGVINWYSGFMLFIVTVICGGLAHSRISADEQLLKSAYRLR
jgi:heme/copper-type cytochrome/quinol oxidase subunit 4